MNIDELKEDVPIEMVLEHFGATVNGRGYGEWRPMNCPWCGDSNGSASVNLRSGYFLCHQCGAPDRPNGKAGDIVDIAMFEIGTRDVAKATTWLNETFRN